jgi:hypothetical protein
MPASLGKTPLGALSVRYVARKETVAEENLRKGAYSPMSSLTTRTWKSVRVGLLSRMVVT